jgi:hypothetical protein
MGGSNSNYKPCCLIYPTNKDSIKTVKTIIVSSPESQRLLNLNSCYKCKYVPPPAIQYGNKHDSYDRVLRRRRGQAFNQK